MLRRFADHRLRRLLVREIERRKHLEAERRRLVGLLRQSRAAERTNYDLAQRWKSIAQQQAAYAAELRAEHRQETTP